MEILGKEAGNLGEESVFITFDQRPEKEANIDEPFEIMYWQERNGEKESVIIVRLEWINKEK